MDTQLCTCEWPKLLYTIVVDNDSLMLTLWLELTCVHTVCLSASVDLLEDTDYFGFPCVISRDSPILAGYITRKDIIFALGERRREPDIILLLVYVLCGTVVMSRLCW